MTKRQTTIKDILTSDDKVKFAEWVSNHINQADKCVVVFGSHNSETHELDITGLQLGFDYSYELDGFLRIASDTFCNGEDADA